jgi:hypothetical protein
MDIQQTVSFVDTKYLLPTSREHHPSPRIQHNINHGHPPPILSTDSGFPPPTTVYDLPRSSVDAVEAIEERGGDGLMARSCTSPLRQQS